MRALVLASLAPCEFSHLKTAADEMNLNWHQLGYELGAFDEIAIQLAIKKYSHDVTVLNIGRECEQEALIKCYGLGAKEVFMFKTENNFSPRFVFEVAKKFISVGGPFDEIFVGRQSSCFSSGETAALLREHYGNTVRVCGGHDILDEDLRLPSFRDMMLAKQKEIHTLDYAIENDFLPARFKPLPQKDKCIVYTEQTIEGFAQKLLQYIKAIPEDLYDKGYSPCYGGRLLSDYPGSKTAEQGDGSVYVCGGRGMLPFKNWGMLEDFTRMLHGETYCTKPIYDAGLLSGERHAGQTGTSLSGVLYVGVGVSGALQHVAGIMGCKKITAINNDDKAPILNYCDAALIGDAKQLLPLLTKILKALGQLNSLNSVLL